MQIDPSYGMLQKLSLASEEDKRQITNLGRTIADQKVAELLGSSHTIHSATSVDYQEFSTKLRALTQIEPDELHNQISALYQQVIRVSDITDRETYLEYVCQVERILYHSEVPLYNQFVRPGALPSCETIRGYSTFKSFEITLDALKEVLQYRQVTLFISYESSAENLKEMLVKHLTQLGVIVNQELILNTDPNKHYEQVYQKDYVLVLGTPEYRKHVPEVAMVQHRWLKQQHRILRVLLAGQVETSFPTLLNTAAVPFIDLVREDQYFSAFFQIVERLFATTLDDNIDLKGRIQSFRTTLPQCPTPIPPPSSYSILTSQLRNYYKSEYGHIKRFLTETQQLPISLTYIQLVHVLEQQQHKKEQDASKITTDYLTLHEAIYEAKEPLPLQKLFSPTDKPYERILIEGRAGIGKSTFCQYIAYHWGKLSREERQYQLGPWANQFDLLLWIPLRKLNKKIDSSVTHESLIRRLCFPAATKQADLTLMLNDASCSILYILDGFDEIAHINQEISHRRDLLHQLLEKQNWIVTSRPNFFKKKGDSKMLHLENIGFTTEDITNFSNRFFEDFNKTEKSKTFATLLSRSAPIRLMAHIPINLELLCTHLLDHSLPEDITLTGIYTAVKRNLFRRRILHTLGDNEIDAHPMHHYLELIAWDAMQDKSLHLSPKLFDTAIQHIKMKESKRKKFLEKVKNSLGFLKSVSSDKHRNKTYYFIHLTFQEYFAACFLAKWLITSPEEATNWIKCNKFDRRYEMTLVFTAGLLSDDQMLNLFFNTLFGEPNSLSTVQESCLCVRCLDGVDRPQRWNQYSFFLHHLTHLLQAYQWNPDFYKSHFFPVLQHLSRFFSEKCIKDYFISTMTHPNVILRIAATQLIGMIKPTDPAFLKELIKLLSDKNRFVLDSVLKTLQQVNLEELEIESQLIDLLSETDQTIMRSDSHCNLPSTLFSTIAALKPPRSSSCNMLIQLLNNSDTTIRFRTVAALAVNGPSHPDIIPALKQLLNDPVEEVRAFAVLAIGAIKSDDLNTLPLLTEILCHPDMDMKKRAAIALAETCPHSPPVVRILACNNYGVDYQLMQHAEKAFRKIQPIPDSVIEELIKQLLSSDRQIKKEAIEALGKIPYSDRRVMQALLGLLSDPEKEIRSLATASIQQKIPFDPNTVEDLSKFLSNPDSEIKLCALQLLFRNDPHHSLCSQTVLRLLSSNDTQLQSLALRCLATLKVLNSDVYKGILNLFSEPISSVRAKVNAPLSQYTSIQSDDYYHVREEAIKTLSGFHSVQSAVFRVLRALLSDHEVQTQVKSALELLFTPQSDVLTSFRKLLSNTAIFAAFIKLFEANSNVKEDAITCVVILHLPDKKIRNKLAELLNDRDPIVQLNAATALIQIDPQNPQAIQTFTSLLTSQDSFYTSDIYSVLRRIGDLKLNSVAINCKLVDLLKHSNGRGWYDINKTLKKIKPTDVETCQDLVQLLYHYDRMVRMSAAEILSECKPNSPQLLLQLLEIASKPENIGFEEAKIVIGSLETQKLITCLLDGMQEDKQKWLHLLKMHLEQNGKLLYSQKGCILLMEGETPYPLPEEIALDVSSLLSLSCVLTAMSKAQDTSNIYSDEEKTMIACWTRQKDKLRVKRRDPTWLKVEGSLWKIIDTTQNQSSAFHALLGKINQGIYQTTEDLRGFFAAELQTHWENPEVQDILQHRLRHLLRCYHRKEDETHEANLVLENFKVDKSLSHELEAITQELAHRMKNNTPDQRLASADKTTFPEEMDVTDQEWNALEKEKHDQIFKYILLKGPYLDAVRRNDFRLNGDEIQLAAHLFQINFVLFSSTGECQCMQNLEGGYGPVVMIEQHSGYFARCHLVTLETVFGLLRNAIECLSIRGTTSNQTQQKFLCTFMVDSFETFSEHLDQLIGVTKTKEWEKPLKETLKQVQEVKQSLPSCSLQGCLDVISGEISIRLGVVKQAICYFQQALSASKRDPMLMEYRELWENKYLAARRAHAYRHFKP